MKKRRFQVMIIRPCTWVSCIDEMFLAICFEVYAFTWCLEFSKNCFAGLFVDEIFFEKHTLNLNLLTDPGLRDACSSRKLFVYITFSQRYGGNNSQNDTNNKKDKSIWTNAIQTLVHRWLKKWQNIPNYFRDIYDIK